MASMFFAVSMNVSPLATLLPLAVNSTVSAPDAARPAKSCYACGWNSRRRCSHRSVPWSSGSFPRTALRGLLEAKGRIQNHVDLVRGQALQIQQVPPRPRAGGQAKSSKAVVIVGEPQMERSGQAEQHGRGSGGF